jgi:hypothetical protein
MKCPSCGCENREGAKFCGECAAILADALVCAKCGTANPKGRKFCDSCGNRIGDVANRAQPPDPRSYMGVVAEPGTGKSRLCFEFAERCRAREEIWPSRGRHRALRRPESPGRTYRPVIPVPILPLTWPSAFRRRALPWRRAALRTASGKRSPPSSPISRARSR